VKATAMEATTEAPDPKGRRLILRRRGTRSPGEPRKHLIMRNKSQGTWYVSFELPQGKRALARATKTFPNEREAKKFARAKLVETPNVTAGTLNPHLPKRAIAPTLMLEWLDESG
jgi:hypothetical protein